MIGTKRTERLVTAVLISTAVVITGFAPSVLPGGNVDAQGLAAQRVLALYSGEGSQAAADENGEKEAESPGSRLSSDPASQDAALLKARTACLRRSDFRSVKMIKRANSLLSSNIIFKRNKTFDLKIQDDEDAAPGGPAA
ncbi:MAG: hypothetical protein ACOX4I_02585 [Anaerovoracaceae bacterium]|jgi:hypothetical protein